MRTSKITSLLTVLAASLVIAGCGENVPTAGATIGGTITGLPAGVTLLLVNSGTDTISVNANGSFTFDAAIQPGSAYSVSMFNQPTGANCSVSNGAGTVDQNADNVTNVSVSCSAAAISLLNFNVGVTVSGLNAGNSVTFLNNGGTSLTANGNGLFVFSATYSVESAATMGAYNVTVSSGPNGQTCTLRNFVGTNAGSAFSDFVDVTADCK